MKKITIILMTIAIVLSLSLTAFASGAFVSSPSAKDSPELVGGESLVEHCESELIITSFANKGVLPEAVKAKLDAAYKQISESGSDNAFTKILGELAKTLNMDISALSVSDLFDISPTDCDSHDDHGFIITIKVSDIKNFKGILHYATETWEICEIKEINEEAGTVTFLTTTLSPFAIVVDNGTVLAPANNAWVWIVVASVAVVAIVLVVVVLKKRSAKA